MSDQRSAVASTCLAILLMGYPLTVNAYKEPTHKQMSVAAANASVLSQASTLSALGLLYAIDNTLQRFPNSVVPDGNVQSGNRMIIELIQDGAAFEDSDTGHRSLNHFFDPTNNQPLSVPGIANPFLPLHYTSPDWALKDNPNITVQAQTYSYQDAHNYFYNALTLRSATTRAQNWGLLFQTLGQITHHLQDMAQPQHVRNDSHLDQFSEMFLGIQLNPYFNPSHYEKYSNDVNSTLPYTASTNNPFPTVVDISKFPTARSFWINNGMGIADFTNANFVSAGTNFALYPNPVIDPSLSSTTDIQTLFAEPGAPCTNCNLTGVITFLGNDVTDPYSGGPTVNLRASTNSIFDWDLTKANSKPVYTLNRFNFIAAQSFLIPRAVAYSAGLINYFFRGQMSISLPNEGVYGIADHTSLAGSDPQTGGFPKIKLELQNTTPGGVDANGNPVVAPMAEGSRGTLVAIVKFHRNTCYRADLSGEYGSPNMAWNQPCPGYSPTNLPPGYSYAPGAPPPARFPDEEIVVSAAHTVPTGINSAPQELTFDFSQNVIPISATDLFLQVVYRGALGSESDAVVVATKDISEPTYVYEWFGADQELYCAPWPNTTTGSNCSLTYQQWCSTGFASQDACNQATGFTLKVKYSPTASPIPGYDSSNSTVPPDTSTDLSQEAPFNPVWTVPVPVGSLARVAVLGDAKPSNLSLVVFESIDASHGTAQFAWHNQFPPGTINQVDPQTQTLTSSVQYQAARGVFVMSADYPRITSGDATNVPPLKLINSQVNF